MILVNLLKHDVKIETPAGMLTIPASGRTATVIEQPSTRHTIDVEGVGPLPVTAVETSVAGIPDKQEDIAYLVTYKTLHALHALGYDTSDVYAPDLLIRDTNGRVIACRQLMQLKAGQGR